MCFARGSDVARYAVRILQALRNGYVPVQVLLFVAKMHIDAVFKASLQAQFACIQISSNERSWASIVNKPLKNVLASCRTQLEFVRRGRVDIVQTYKLNSTFLLEPPANAGTSDNCGFAKS